VAQKNVAQTKGVDTDWIKGTTWALNHCKQKGCK